MQDDKGKSLLISLSGGGYHEKIVLDRFSRKDDYYWFPYKYLLY